MNSVLRSRVREAEAEAWCRSPQLCALQIANRPQCQAGTVTVHCALATCCRLAASQTSVLDTKSQLPLKSQFLVPGSGTFSMEATASDRILKILYERMSDMSQPARMAADCRYVQHTSTAWCRTMRYSLMLLHCSRMSDLLSTKAAALHACQMAERGVQVRESSREPQRGCLGDMHPHIESQQFLLAEQAGGGAAQRAIAQLAVHTDVGAQLPPDPNDNLMGLHTINSCLPCPQIEEPAA